MPIPPILPPVVIQVPRRPGTTPLPTPAPTPAPAPTPVPSPRAPSTKVANRRAVALLRKQYKKLQQDSYAIGKALHALQKTDVVAQYGEANFNDFVDKHVMPLTTALRCMVVSEHFTKTTATKLGIRKAELLHRYVALAELRTNAEALAKVDRRIGSPSRPISTLSTRDLEVLIQQTKMRQGRAQIPKPSQKTKRAVAKMRAEFIEHFGVVPTMRIDMKRNVVELELPLSDAGEIVGVEE